jgi:hypothetical protein
MRCSLDIYTDYLISSTGQATATGLSSLYDGAISHDQVTRLLTSSYFDSKDLWRKAKPLIRQTQAKLPKEEFAVLIVDDSYAEKPHTDESALIATYWDHSLKRYIKGVNFLTLLYQAGDLSVPIASVLIEKTKPEVDKKTGKTRYKSELTKNEHFRQMLTVAHQQVDYKYVLADSWYASAENINHVIGLDHHFVFALEASRTVALSEQERKQGKFQSLDALVFPDKAPLKVYLRSVQEALLLTRQVFTNKDGSQGCLYLITSDTTLSYDQITTIYQRRWKVEEYHKSLKQNASFGDSPTKNPDTQSNHFFASMLAYIKLEALKLKHSIGHFRIKAQLYMAGLKAMHQQLTALKLSKTSA